MNELDFSGLLHSDLRNVFRKEVIRHSIEIMRRHGLLDKDIKKQLSRDFSVDEKLIDEMLMEKI